MSGLHIVFEGGDGGGKTTQCDLVQSWLEERGLEVVRTREPGGTRLGAELRQLLLHGDAIDPRAEALLYAADRAQHVATIVRPALERGAVVVQDRYIDSSLAYQGAGRVLERDDVRQISEWATGNLWPDLTVLLDVPFEVAEARRRTSESTADRLESESEEFHNQVRQEFLQLAEADPLRYLVVDATAEIDEVHAQVIAGVAPLVTHF